MSTNIPTRRVTRTTRTATMKDTENANARPSRIVTRAKPTSLANATTTGGLGRATMSSKAKANNEDSKLENPVGKRKREALGEVTAVANNKPRGTAAAKGKTKLNGVEVSKAAPPVARQPLRTVAATRNAARAKASSLKPIEPVQEVQEEPEERVILEVHDEHAMVVDNPPVEAHRRISQRTSVRKNSTTVLRQSGAQRWTETRSIQRLDIDTEERSRVFKKRRTSSEAPEDAPRLEEEKIDHDSEAIAEQIAADLEVQQEEVEADPDGDHWDDLDADDADDPLMASEYVVEIFKYLREVELLTLANPDYMSSQKELSWQMRGILTDWLVQVHLRFRLLPETLFLCVNIIDRFLSARVVSLAKLQLVGVTCMFIAAKFEEIVAPSVTHFLHCADSSYTESEILLAERYVLKTLDYNMSYPNPVHFLRRVSKADDYNVNVRTLAKYLLEISCVEWRLVAAPPSLLAAASIWLARLALGMEDWTPNLAHYSSYPESALIPTANIMLNYILKPIRHDSFYKKYASKRLMKSSPFMRQWAIERWGEGVHIDLMSELPNLKREIRETRALNEQFTEECNAQQVEVEAEQTTENTNQNAHKARKGWTGVVP